MYKMIIYASYTLISRFLRFKSVVAVVKRGVPSELGCYEYDMEI